MSLFIICKSNCFVSQRSKLQSVRQYIIKPQNPRTFGLGRVKRYLILLHFISPCGIKSGFQRLSVGESSLAHVFAVLGNELFDLMNVPVKPAFSRLIRQFGKLLMQITEISSELLLLLWSGSFFVGDTAPRTESSPCIVHIGSAVSEHISPSDYSQHTGQTCEVLHHLKAETSEEGKVTLSAAFVNRLACVSLEFFNFVQHYFSLLTCFSILSSSRSKSTFLLPRATMYLTASSGFITASISFRHSPATASR